MVLTTFEVTKSCCM